MKIPLQWTAGLLAILLVACRSTPDVIVTDDKGAPVAGAAVEAVTPSLNYPAVTTDAKGEVNIDSKMQKVETINVKKAGFADQNSIKFTGPKPIRVILKP